MTQANTTDEPRRDASDCNDGLGQMRLYVVRVVREAYVLAKDDEEAADMQREIERWETAKVIVSRGSERLDGWEPTLCMVYHKGREDISLAAARRKFPAA